MVDRTVLVALLAAADAPGGMNLSGEERTRRERLLRHAHPQDVGELLRGVAEATERPLRPQRSDDIAFAVSYVMDCDQPHRGPLRTLVRRAVRWHRERAWRPTAEDSGRAVAGPRIPLPEDPGVRFLATVGDVVEEGRAMGHCVATRAAAALAGDAYLFHVEHKEKRATVEVAPEGYVRQASGPSNSQNAACRYGERVCGEWARGLAGPAWANANLRGSGRCRR